VAIPQKYPQKYSQQGEQGVLFMEKKLRLDISYSMVPEVLGSVLGITEKLCFTGKIHRQLVEGLLGRFYWEWLKLEKKFGSFYKKE
jgi:hypothetical protein